MDKSHEFCHGDGDPKMSGGKAAVDCKLVRDAVHGY